MNDDTNDVIPLATEEQLQALLVADVAPDIRAAAHAALAGDFDAHTRCSEFLYWAGQQETQP